MDGPTLLLGLGIFIARIIDVSMGTIRTIAIVQGRMVMSFFLGFAEVALWITVASAVIPMISGQPILAVFYALGFSTGNVVGIAVEKKLAMGQVMLQLISHQHGDAVASALRTAGFPVTIIEGEGSEGDVDVLFSICSRRSVRKLIKTAESIEPGIFFVTATAGDLRQYKNKLAVQPTGWRSILKRK